MKQRVTKKEIDIMDQQLEQDPNFLFHYPLSMITKKRMDMALQKGFHPTREELLNHSEFCENKIFMDSLKRRDSFYAPFDRNMSLAEKRAFMIPLVKEKNYQAIAELPFLDSRFGYEGGGNLATLVLQELAFDFDEEDSKTQRKFYEKLNKMVDGVASLQYASLRKAFPFVSFDQINDMVIEVFQRAKINQDSASIDSFAFQIANSLDDSKHLETYQDILSHLYQIYEHDGVLPYHVTTKFYGEILRKQKEHYTSREKKKLIASLKEQLPLQKKTAKKFLIAKELKKVKQSFQEQKKEILGLTTEEWKRELEKVHQHLLTMKPLKEESLPLTEETLQMLDQAFLQGTLDEEVVASLFPQISKKKRKMLVNQYVKRVIPHLTTTSLADSMELYEEHFAYHYHYYKIATKKKYWQNVCSLVLSCDKAGLEDILYETKKKNDLKELIPRFDLLPFCSLKVLEAMIRNRSRIFRQLKEASLVTNDSLDSFMNHFERFVRLAKAYGSADDLMLAALGKERVEAIVEDELTSQDLRKYLWVYEKMIKQKKTSIPPVSGVYQNYSYATAENFDAERLLIGKRCFGSCMGIEGAGEKAYLKGLYEKDGDVLLIKKKDTKEFVARALLFRKGNFVVMAPIHDAVGIADKFYQKEFLDLIGEEMLQKAKKSGDNLEYVFVTNVADLLEGEYKEIEHAALKDDFPHADLEEYAYLITPWEEEIDPNPNIKAQGSYAMKRSEIKDMDQVTEEEMTQLKALSILFESDPIQKEEKARDFEPFEKKKYKALYKGDDWYLALKDDKTLETVTLPISSVKQKREMEQAKKALMQSYQENRNNGMSRRGR